MKVLVAGDFCPRDRVLLQIKEGQTDEILQDVMPFTQSADLAIVNFECPVVGGKSKPIHKVGPLLKCPPESVEMIRRAGFGLVTLANNHFYDQGEVGVRDTIAALRQSGIDFVGGGFSLAEASQSYKFCKNGRSVSIINCCEHEFSVASIHSGGANPLSAIQQWYAIQEARQCSDFVIVVVHGGHEHFQYPSPRMVELYRYFIDAGADVVVNHHQHCYSGYEVYRGKPIFYGLGNFCMDDHRYRNSKWNEGYFVVLDLSENIRFDVVPYVQGNDTASVVLMQGQRLSGFENQIQEINKTIGDGEALNRLYAEWVQKASRSYILAAMPYPNKYFRYLALKGFLPLWPRRKRLYSLLNWIQCESHRDRIIGLIKDHLSRQS